jgi:nitrogen fixation protein NifU and related proteins
MDLSDLYRDVILDHNRRPRNFGPLEAADASAEGVNPLCGDRLTLRLRLGGGAGADTIEDVRFEGQGCAISTASASLMTEAVKGKTRAEALELFERVHRLLTDETPADGDLGKLAALSGVREYPSRVKCASLCWHTLVSALKSGGKPDAPAVSTE